MRTSACILVSLLCAACATSAPREDRPPLPFHIAIAPISGGDIHTDRKPGNEGDATEHMQIQPTEAWKAALTSGLKESLERYAFARVSLLGEPVAAAATEAEDASQRDMQLVQEAFDRGADLLLCLDISIQPVIRQKKNGTFWVNLPLFLLGGPFGWWLPDRTYIVEVAITGRFYDPRSLHRGPLEVPLREVRPEVASAGPATERMDLEFVNRAPNFGQYLLSCICPAGFLAVDSEELGQELAQGIVEQLGSGLARSVLDQSNLFERGAAPFFLDVEQSKLEDVHSASLLRGNVSLRPTREIESLESVKVQVEGGATYLCSFEELPTQDGYQRYHFEQPLGKLHKGTAVRLEIEAGERTPRVRSYTFCVGDARAP